MKDSLVVAPISPADLHTSTRKAYERRKIEATHLTILGTTRYCTLVNRQLSALCGCALRLFGRGWGFQGSAILAGI